MKTILITGGAGFVGRNLINFLKDNYKIIVIDDLSSGFKKNIDKKVVFFKGSINDDKILHKAFNFKPHYVIHLAALFANQNSVDNPINDLTTNGLGTIKIFDYCKKYGVKKIIFSSSSCVYGNLKKMNEESFTRELSTPYAITKLLGEFYAKFWSDYHGLNILVVRLFNVYGPGDFPGKFRSVIPNFFLTALNNESLVITGNGNETRDFTYVRDVVKIFKLLLLKKTNSFDIINIGSGSSNKIIDIANEINFLTKNKKNIIFKKTRKWDDVSKRMSNNVKLKKYIKDFKFTNLREGLDDTYKWIKHIHKKL